MLKSQMEAPQLRTALQQDRGLPVALDCSSSPGNRELGCWGLSHHTPGSLGVLDPSCGTQSKGVKDRPTPILHIGHLVFFLKSFKG